MAEGWHLDKKVPLSIICAILMQTAALIVWGSKLDNRVTAMEQNVTNHAATISSIKDTQSNISVGLARMEERQIITAEGVREIKQRLERR